MKKVLTSILFVSIFLSSCEYLDDFLVYPDEDSNGNTGALTFAKIGTLKNGSGDEGFAEISAYDPKTKKLFIVNPTENEVSVWDISDPSSNKKLTSITDFGTTGAIPNSVDVYDGLLAVALENADKQALGNINIYDTGTQLLKTSYLAGSLPDMVTFSPDGKYLISANEGEPSDDYKNDPEGSITVIDLKNIRSTTLSFTAYNGTDIGNGFRVFGPDATFAQDVEPEYVAVSDDSKFAYVALQENNGIAVVDLDALSIIDIFGLGTKDHLLPQNNLDASNRDGMAGNFKNWPVLGLYQPDAITYVEVHGRGYLVSANEGDARDYDGYSEEVRVEDLILDETAFPNATELQLEENLGRLKTTTANGDIDGDGDFDEIYAYGARSFTIWDTHGNQIYDSGDEIGRRTFEINPGLFNNDEGEVDDRSDDKGAEPEAVTTLKIGDSTILFVGLERTGGALVYDITNPTAPEFLEWIFDAQDVATEGLLSIPAEESPTGENLLIITNEVSNTVSIYEIK